MYIRIKIMHAFLVRREIYQTQIFEYKSDDNLVEFFLFVKFVFKNHKINRQTHL